MQVEEWGYDPEARLRNSSSRTLSDIVISTDKTKRKDRMRTIKLGA